MDAMDAAWRILLDLGAVEGEEQTSKLTALGRHVSTPRYRSMWLSLRHYLLTCADEHDPRRLEAGQDVGPGHDLQVP